MKKLLHELERESPLRVEMENGAVDFATFHHTDGMYSLCTTSDEKPFHLSVMTPMVLVDGRWEIEQEEK